VRGLEPHDRPREKLLRLGPAALGDNELLAIVIGSGTRQVDALGVANTLLETSGGLAALARERHDGLRRVKGLGTVKATQVQAAIELGRRSLAHRSPKRVQLLTPGAVAAYLMPEYGARPVEQFGVVLLDTKHRVLRTAVVGVGSLDSAPVQPRDVFREATAAGAAAVVLFHNHPSGDPVPSRDDFELTGRMAGAGALLGIDVLDHLVLGDGRYFSFKENGRLEAV
jgi:DNA repair protein RadC